MGGREQRMRFGSPPRERCQKAAVGKGAIRLPFRLCLLFVLPTYQTHLKSLLSLSFEKLWCISCHE